MRSPENLTKLLNQSGFPLQMGIEQLVNAHAPGLRWKVFAREYGWRAPDGQSGFIDLVLEDEWQSSVLVVECKRVVEADWLFLIDSTTEQETSRTRLWISNTKGHGKQHLGFFDVFSEPASPESMFCVVAGQDPKARPMLERTAAELSAATEALAVEEYPLMVQRQFGIRMYASVIITTARLTLSSFDPSETNLEIGEVRQADHQVVPWIRFRKAFSSERAVEPEDPQWNFSSLANAKEKLVFVVNVMAFEEFLRRWSIIDTSLRGLW